MKFKQREIKFRVWDKSRGRFHGGCISNICLTLGGRLMWQFGFKSPDLLGKEESKNYVIQQFTGLKDKRGKEIYEGDIITYRWERKKEVGYVKWTVAMFEVFSFEDSELGMEPMDDMNTYEVIGNIFENPELLKEAKK